MLADAFVADGGISQRRPGTRPGPSTPSPPTTRWPRRGPRPTAPGRPATVCETAIQVHGGIGNTWECLAHVFLRRALLSADVGRGRAELGPGAATTESGPTMDFGDSPESPPSGPAPRLAAGSQSRAAGFFDRRRLLGRDGGVARVLYDAGFFATVLAHRDRGDRGSRPSSRSLSTRSSRRRGPRPGPGLGCLVARNLWSTAATRSGAGSWRES